MLTERLLAYDSGLARLFLQADLIMSYTQDHNIATAHLLAQQLRNLADDVERGLVAGSCGVAVYVDGLVTFRTFGVFDHAHLLANMQKLATARACPQ
jgi:hypothetical protein